jgi:GNAT superfamily N-acetyltransferase
MIEMREASAGDRDAILALRKRAFPRDDLEKQEPAFWDWEFAGGRNFVAEDEGRVVGHFGFVAQRYRIGERVVPALLAVDAMVDPEQQRRGIFTKLARFAVNRVHSDVPLVIGWQIRPAVLEGMKRAGWEQVASAPIVLRPTFFSLPRPAHRHDPPTAQPEYDKYRFANPRWTYTRRENEHAYLVSRDAVLKGINTHCLVDFGGDPRALRSLIRDAVRDARRRRVLLAAALVSRDHPHYRTLAHCGFVPGPHRFRFLAQSFDPSLRLEQRWGLTWASSDHV